MEDTQRNKRIAKLLLARMSYSDLMKTENYLRLRLADLH